MRVVPYDVDWPAQFAAEAHRIHQATASELPLALEHTGSTAVPGLAAKPIVDILAGHEPGAPVRPYIEKLIAAGYSYRGEQGIAGRHFFRSGEPRAWHVHMAEKGGSFWRDQLDFRNALRADAALRDAYAALKLDLAARYPRDRETYIEGKTEFVLRVLLEHRSKRNPSVTR